jgi:hypothetical protein
MRGAMKVSIAVVLEDQIDAEEVAVTVAKMQSLQAVLMHCYRVVGALRKQGSAGDEATCSIR